MSDILLMNFTVKLQNLKSTGHFRHPREPRWLLEQTACSVDTCGSQTTDKSFCVEDKGASGRQIPKEMQTKRGKQ